MWINSFSFRTLLPRDSFLLQDFIKNADANGAKKNWDDKVPVDVPDIIDNSRVDSHMGDNYTASSYEQEDIGVDSSLVAYQMQGAFH